MLTFFLAPLAAALVSSTAPLPVADVYVDVSAANCATATGSAADPVCSITAAIAIASPGDTIRIAPGTYIENVDLPFDLTLLGTGGADVTIVDGSLSGTVITIPAAVAVEIEGLTITRGQAPSGGGIKLSGDLVLTNSTICANRSADGAGIAADMLGGGADLTIRGSTIDNNRAYGLGYGNGLRIKGGGISQLGGSLTILNSTVHKNIARVGEVDDYYYYCPIIACNYADVGEGGGIYALQADLSITNSTISECEAFAVFGFGTGGGLCARQCTLDIVNTTLSGNASGSGSSVFSSSTNAGSAFSSVTVSGGFGSSSLRFHGGPVEMLNCLVATSPSTVNGPVLSLGHNLFDTGAAGIVDGVNGDIAGTISLPVSALLGELRDNGGPTQTHSLLLGSPAIDGSDPVVFTPFDQRGVARPLGSLPDIGAFESDGTAPSLCNGDGGVPGCAQCPCGNNAPLGTIGGCLNSSGSSARIYGTGDPSVSLPPMSTTDLRLTMTGANTNSLCVMYSGDAVAPGVMTNPCFGLQTGVQSNFFDGLRCAVMNARRAGSRPTDSNGDVGITNNAWGGSNAPNAGLAVRGGFAAGQTRYFQAQFRENSMQVCMRGLNTSQAIRVTFTP